MLAKIFKNGNPSTGEDTEKCTLLSLQYPLEAIDACLLFDPAIFLEAFVLSHHGYRQNCCYKDGNILQDQKSCSTRNMEDHSATFLNSYLSFFFL